MPPTEEDIAWFQSTFRPIPKPALPEDSIEYSIYILSTELDANHDSELRSRLRDVQKSANVIQKEWLNDYIWQRQGFSLELLKEDGVILLRGRTEYGDSIEDEWVIVWLLRELTKKFADAWIKVTDSDGEFLLIEASGTIPSWLDPEVAENRVWINNGQLKIIRPAGAARSSKRTVEKLSVTNAQAVMLNDPKRIMHSASIEEEAFYRLRNYPQQIKDNMHHALVTIPRKVAFLLLQKPAYISPAIEAFYLRDPIALKSLQTQGEKGELTFSPTDLATLRIKFPRVGYAQIKSQDFPAPTSWKKSLPSKLDDKVFTRAETGMKLSCGLEMLLSDSQYQDKQYVREMKMLLEDLRSGDGLLPTDDELAKRDQSENDESWLDINMEDLDKELGGNSKSAGDGKKRDFGDKAVQENIQRIVKQFETFLNDKDGPDASGMFEDESDDDLEGLSDSEEGEEGEDKEGSFNEDDFTKMMQEMMGMPPEVMREIMGGTIDALRDDQKDDAPSTVRDRARAKVQEVESSSDDEDLLGMKQMEAELQASGALNLQPNGPRQSGQIQATRSNDPGGGPPADAEAGTSDEDDDGFEAEFTRNLLQSFKAGGGVPGPASSLLSMMSEQAGEGSSKSGESKTLPSRPAAKK